MTTQGVTAGDKVQVDGRQYTVMSVSCFAGTELAELADELELIDGNGAVAYRYVDEIDA